MTTDKNPEIDVVVRFTTSRVIPPDAREIKLGSYKIHSIPSATQMLVSPPEEALLEFIDSWQNGQRASNPEGEARYILAFLSLLGRTVMHYDSAKINNVNITFNEKRVYKQFLGNLAFPPDFEDIYRSLFALNDKVFIQFIRACLAYQNAVSLIETYPTLGCFLLVVAVECLSNVIGKGRSDFERFRDFILSNLPSQVKSAQDPDLLKEFLKQIYIEYRSGFTHGGKSVPIAALTLAEKSGLKYIKLVEDGRDVKYPSLTWFENVARVSLIEFLRKTGKDKDVLEDRTRLARLALSEAIVTMRLKRPKKAGEVIFQGDVETQ